MPSNQKHGARAAAKASGAKGSGMAKQGGAKKEGLQQDQVAELLYQALETEQGGIKIYEAAVRAAVNEDLKEEWEEYLDQTKHHEEVLRDVFQTMGLDTETETPGRLIVRRNGEGLLSLIEQAMEAGDPNAAEIVAAEVVCLAETKDHLNWELLGEAAKKLSGPQAKALKEAYEEVEDEEDEHLYHTQGWARELWMQALGLPAVLPPPEEEKDVKTAIGAARAKQSRKEML
jgi:rubrerythrin